MTNHPVLFNPAIIHVAVADMDATYGAYVAVNNTTVNDTNKRHPKKQIKFFFSQGKEFLKTHGVNNNKRKRI